METRKSSLVSTKMCRFCLTQEGNLSSLYERKSQSKNAITLALQIMSCVSVEVFPSDGMPSLICERCKFFMDTYYHFKQICRLSDESIMQYVQAGEPLEPIQWPTSLNKLYRQATAPPITKKKVKKSTVDKDQSGSEECDEDESVFNIKIDDDEEKESAVIQVVKSGDKILVTKSEESPKDKATLKKVKSVKANDKPYPCSYCDKSFGYVKVYHRHLRTAHKQLQLRGPFGECEGYQCEECSAQFRTQDELIYHSAQHATENLICPLCQEKFQHVEEVSTHIKTHVEGAEFMCDLCELVFTSKEKLDKHLIDKHEEELKNEEDMGDNEGMDMDDEDEDEDSAINLKEENGEMVVEIKKPNEFIKQENKKSIVAEEPANDGIYSEEGEGEGCESVEGGEGGEETATQSQAQAQSPGQSRAARTVQSPAHIILHKPGAAAAAAVHKNHVQVTKIVKKPEEVKNKSQTTPTVLPPATKVAATEKAKETKVENAAPVPSNDKSLKLLEKELQELKRTTTRNEPVKTPAKTEVGVRRRGPQIHTSTPKPRAVEQKSSSGVKGAAERRAAAAAAARSQPSKEDKDSLTTPKSVVKNGAGDRSNSTDDSIRRSSRTSKVKDYAKMIRERSMMSSDESDDGDEEYKTTETPAKAENRGRQRRNAKSTPVASPVSTAAAATPTQAKKRGRPKKDTSAVAEVPAKIRKSVNDDNNKVVDDEKSKNNDEESAVNDGDSKIDQIPEEKDKVAPTGKENITVTPRATAEKTVKTKDTSQTEEAISPSKNPGMVSPTGQTLKPVPIKSLPPGVKPLPLPVGRPNVCEMQIGKKVVKVQKIVMSKAEVEAMAKKGLLELKDGAMVLKQGIKLPTTDAATLKSTLVGQEVKKPEAAVATVTSRSETSES